MVKPVDDHSEQIGAEIVSTLVHVERPLLDALERCAKGNRATANQEIVKRLEASFYGDQPGLGRLSKHLGRTLRGSDDDRDFGTVSPDDLATAPARVRLPDRRPAETVKLAHEGRTVHATAGFDPATGAVREVFLRKGGAPGSDMDRLLDDVGVVLSRLLQLGEDPAALARGVGRLGWYPRADGLGGPQATPPAASMIGVVADWVAHLALRQKGETDS